MVVLTALDLTAEDRRRLRGANQVLNKGDVSLRDLAEELSRLAAGATAAADTAAADTAAADTAAADTTAAG